MRDCTASNGGSEAAGLEDVWRGSITLRMNFANVRRVLAALAGGAGPVRGPYVATLSPDVCSQFWCAVLATPQKNFVILQRGR